MPPAPSASPAPGPDVLGGLPPVAASRTVGDGLAATAARPGKDSAAEVLEETPAARRKREDEERHAAEAAERTERFRLLEAQQAHAEECRMEQLARTNPLFAKALSAGKQSAADLVTAKATIASLEAKVKEVTGYLEKAEKQSIAFQAEAAETKAKLAERDAEAADLRAKLQAALTKPAAGKPSGSKLAPAPAPAAGDTAANA